MKNTEFLSAQNATEFTVTVTRMIPNKIISNEKFSTARAALETFLDHVEAHEYEYSVNLSGMEAGGIGHDYRIELTAE